MNFLGIRSVEVDRYWNEAQPLLQKAIDRNGNCTAASVLNALRSAEMQLWCAYDQDKMIMAGVTEVSQSPRAKVCLLYLCGGTELASWVDFRRYVEQWAVEQGCAKARIVGRKGWRRLFPDYEERAVVLEKDLVNGR